MNDPVIHWPAPGGANLAIWTIAAVATACVIVRPGKLPEATRASAQSWIAKVQARQVALAAAQALATETASALLRDLLDDMQFWDAFGHGDTLN